MTATALCLAVLLQGAAPAKPGVEIPLEKWSGSVSGNYDNRVFAIRASIGGGPLLRLGLDSSIGAIVLGESAASKCRITPGAAMLLDWVGGDKIRAKWFRDAKLASGTFSDNIAYGLVVPDDALSSFDMLDGLLGMAFLQNYMWTVDPKRGTLTLAPADSPMPTRAGATVPFTLDESQGIQFKVMFGGKPHMLTVSTGLGDVLFDKDLAKRLGIEGTGPVRSDTGVPYQLGPKLPIQLEGLKVPDVQILISQQSGWQHLGQSFLNRFVATWDMKHRKVLLSEP